MTNGIEVNQIVRVKASGQLGRVVGVDDHHDRIPADIMVSFSQEHLVYDRIYNGEVVKYRVDEVEVI